MTASAALFAIGCGNGGGTDTGPGDAGPVDTGGGPVCNPDSGLLEPSDDAGLCLRATRCDSMPWCPARVVNPPMHPKFVMTKIDIQTPTSLGSGGAVGGILNGAIGDGAFFWGIDVDLTVTPNRIRTGSLGMATPGAGTGFLESNFAFVMGVAPAGDAGTGANRWDPITINATVTGDSFTTEIAPLITIPVFGTDAARMLLAELPLRNARMRDVQMGSNRNCVGLARADFNSCLARLWNTSAAPMGAMPYGVLEADLLVDDARNVPVESLMNNLCFFVAGTDCTMPMSAWAHPPDAMINGSTTPNAWHVVANFSAVAARIN